MPFWTWTVSAWLSQYFCTDLSLGQCRQPYLFGSRDHKDLLWPEFASHLNKGCSIFSLPLLLPYVDICQWGLGYWKALFEGNNQIRLKRTFIASLKQIVGSTLWGSPWVQYLRKRETRVKRVQTEKVSIVQPSISLTWPQRKMGSCSDFQSSPPLGSRWPELCPCFIIYHHRYLGKVWPWVRQVLEKAKIQRQAVFW
jgi:hypothetical protein